MQHGTLPMYHGTLSIYHGTLSMCHGTWYMLNNIVLVFCLRRKQCNEDKQYM